MSSESAPQRPVRVVCALIEREGRVLLARRPAHKHLGGKWEFPGGKVEPGESDVVALMRECREELGCEIEPKVALPSVLHAYSDRTIELVPMVCRLRPGGPEPRAGEHSALAWVESFELDACDLPEADVPVVRAYRAWLVGGEETVARWVGGAE